MGVKVRERKPGEWWIFINHKRTRKAVKVGSREAAKAAAKKIEEGLVTGKLKIGVSTVTFGEYAKKWMEGHVASNLKESSQRGYKGILDTHILPKFRRRLLVEITREEIKELCFEKMRTGRVKPKKVDDETMDATLSPRSVSYITRTLSAIFTHAMEDGIITANPAARPGRFLKTGDRRDKIDFLTPKEGRALLDAARAHYPRAFPLLLMAMRTGLRQGEIIALQWGDIDWKGKFFEVRRSNYMGNLTTPKSGKGRRVDMSDQLAAVLTDHKRIVAAEALKAGRAFPAWVFPSHEGTPLESGNVRRSLSLCLKKAGMRHLRFHDLRHSFASYLIANGESLAYVKEQMGHASIQITVDTYGHLIPGANRQAVNRLDDAEWKTTGEKNATPAQLAPSRAESSEGGEVCIALN